MRRELIQRLQLLTSKAHKLALDIAASPLVATIESALNIRVGGVALAVGGAHNRWFTKRRLRDGWSQEQLEACDIAIAELAHEQERRADIAAEKEARAYASPAAVIATVVAKLKEERELRQKEELEAAEAVPL